MTTPKPHSGWVLDPESPFYDEFSDIETGQRWITTPNGGLIGCSSEDDARTILGFEGQLETKERLLDLASEMGHSLEEQLEAVRNVAEQAVSYYIADVVPDAASSFVDEWCRVLGKTQGELDERYWADSFPARMPT